MSFDGIKRAALERITAGSEGARLIGSQLTGVTGNNIQVLLEALLARVLPPGGTTGQVLKKTSGTDYAASWQAEAAAVHASGDYNASQVTNTPAGNIAATTVQAALNELDSEKATPAQIPVVSSQAQADAATDDTTFLSPLKGANMLRVSPTEVSVTGAITLTSTAFGKMHVCSGTAADYTVTLPAASGNAGKVIGFRMANALTKLVTLDGNASETIDGATTRVMWAQESAILLCDGTSWTKIAGRFRPMIGVGKQTTAQSIPATTTTNLTLEAAMVDIGSMVNVASDNIGIRRAGTYLVGGELTLATGQTATRIIMLIAGSGGATVSNEVEVSSTATQPQLLGSGPRSLAVAETVVIQAWHNSAAARSTLVSAEQYQAKVMIEELVTW